jgi:hypothetical protein
MTPDEQETARISDIIRKYCKNKYIDDGRKKKLYVVGIRAGDVHDELNYKNRYPAICAALGSNKFEEECQIKRIAIIGPINGVNTLFVYTL